MGPIFAHNYGVRDLFTAAEGDAVVADDAESVSPLDALVLGTFISFSYSLENSSQIVGIRRVPNVLVLGVALQLDMLKGFTCDVVHDRHVPVKDELSGETELGCLAGFQYNMMGNPLCGSLRARAFLNRLRAWWKGLVGHCNGSTRSCTVGNRILLIFTYTINGHY